ncbi:hypothetical protein MTR_2g007943 [Medicago truncatula]|uniref:Uncharacterized protein n=1 Tax=Medicago truncatula TaxID=3880 RepID=A0A072V526_MEDTR|nr:hypothetical protein MTR_2g007943 [Medicago truncatula]
MVFHRWPFIDKGLVENFQGLYERFLSLIKSILNVRMAPKLVDSMHNETDKATLNPAHHLNFSDNPRTPIVVAIRVIIIECGHVQ